MCSYIPEELVGDWNLGHLVTLRLAFVGTKDIDPAWFGIERIVLPVDGRIGEVDPKTDVERSGPTLVCQVGSATQNVRPAMSFGRRLACSWQITIGHSRRWSILYRREAMPTPMTLTAPTAYPKSDPNDIRDRA